MPTSLEDVVRFLDYSNILERVVQQSAGDLRWETVTYEIIPKNTSGGTIELLFDETRTFVDCVSWRNWHAHFDSHGDERVNTRNALRFIRNIMRKRYVLVEFMNKTGQYRGSSVERSYDFQRFIRENRELYEQCTHHPEIGHYRISRFNEGFAVIPE